MNASQYKRAHHSDEPQYLGENTWFYDADAGIEIFHEVTEDETFHSHRPAKYTQAEGAGL
jgi:hypothetical protein